MRRALTLSLALHLALGLAALGFARPRDLPVEDAVLVELVAATEVGPAQSAPPAPAEAAPLPPREAAAPAPPPRPEPPPEPPAPRPEAAEPAPVPREPAATAPTPPRPPAPKPAPPRPEPAREEPKPAKEEPKPAPVERRVVEKPPADKPRPSEPPKAAEPPPRPTPRPQAAKPEPPRPEQSKAEQTRPQPPKPPQEDSFAALLRSVERLERRVQADAASPGRGRGEPLPSETRGGPLRADQALTQGEIDAIRRQIERCWNVPVGVRGIESMQVRLRIAMNRDGSVARVGIEDQARMAADPAFRTVAESAQRAVLSCQLALPAEKYEQWREMVMTFHPKDALNG